MVVKIFALIACIVFIIKSDCFDNTEEVDIWMEMTEKKMKKAE